MLCAADDSTHRAIFAAPSGIDVPVSFDSIRLRFDVSAPNATPEQLRALQEKTEQYCVVMQTLTRPPKLQSEWAGLG